MSINFLNQNRNNNGMDMPYNRMDQTPTTVASQGRAVDVSKFNRVINFCLVALVIILPMLFLPFTSEAREFNKQAMLFLATVIMLGVWVIKILSSRSVSWVKTSLDFVLAGYLAIYLLSALFSLDKASSFLGYYGRFTGSFLSVFSLIILYYLIVNNVRSQGALKKVNIALLIGTGIVVVYSLLQLLGVHIIPFDFAKARSFNPIGSMVALSIFSGLTLIVIQWSLLANRDLTKVTKMILVALSLAALTVMFLVNAFIGWLVLCLGMIAFMALGMVLTSHHDADPNKAYDHTWFWKPMLILVISILFVGFNFLPQSMNPRQLVSLDLPVEVQLSNSTTFSLVKNSLSSGGKQAMLGSGPGTVGIAFGDIKPESLNKTIVWSLNFDRASSEVANIAIETGILGVLAFEITAILFLIYGLFFLLRNVNHPGRMQAFGLFVLWATLYISHFFYFYNTTFYFLYWLSIACFMAVAHWSDQSEANRNLSFSSSPRSALSWMFASLLMLAVLLVGTFFQAAIYVAEASYASGLKTLNQQNPDFAKAEQKFGRAVSLNNYRDVYYLAYGQNLIFLASQEAAKQNPNIQNIQNWLANAVNAGLAATTASPAKAANWSALAQFYGNIRPLGVAGTDDAIINSWNKAIERDPINPALLVQVARAYALASEEIDPSIAGSGPDADNDGLADAKEQELGSDPNNVDSNGNSTSDGDEVRAGFNPAGTGRIAGAQLSQFIKLDKEMLKKAEESLRKAIELKSDLAEARIELARVLEKNGKIAEARTALDEAVKSFPNNVEVKFEQGRIAYNQKKYDEAEKILGDVIKLQANHANAMYSLGLVYIQKNDLNKALTQLEKVRELTGPNVDLERAINNLKAQLNPVTPEPNN